MSDGPTLNSAHVQIRLESRPDSAKVTALGLLLPRYRHLRAMRGVDEALQVALRHATMTCDEKLIYITNSKVASTAMGRLMLAHQRRSARQPTREEGGGRLLNFREWRAIRQAISERRGVVFSLTRHPVDRLLSVYRGLFVRRGHFGRRHMRGMRDLGFSPTAGQARNFDAFLDYVELSLAASELYSDRHWRKQVHALAWGCIDYDHVGRLETIEQDMRRVFDLADIDADGLLDLLALRVNNTDEIERYTPTAAQRRRIESLYADDFEAFGY